MNALDDEFKELEKQVAAFERQVEREGETPEVVELRYRLLLEIQATLRLRALRRKAAEVAANNDVHAGTSDKLPDTAALVEALDRALEEGTLDV